MLHTRLGELEAPGQHRVDDDLIAIQSETKEFATALDPGDPLADQRGKLRGRAADGQRPRRLDARDMAPAEGCLEGLGDDGQVGKFGHGCRL